LETFEIKLEVNRKDYIQELNLYRVYQALIPIENYMNSNLSSVCNSVKQNITMRKIKRQIFFDEVETQLREKPLRGNQTQNIHYSEDKAST